jgi:hypothetical protein
MLTDGSSVSGSDGDGDDVSGFDVGGGSGSAVDGSGDISGSFVDRYRCCQWLSFLPLLLTNTCVFITRVSSD